MCVCVCSYRAVATATSATTSPSLFLSTCRGHRHHANSRNPTPATTGAATTSAASRALAQDRRNRRQTNSTTEVERRASRAAPAPTSSSVAMLAGLPSSGDVARCCSTSSAPNAHRVTPPVAVCVLGKKLPWNIRALRVRTWPCTRIAFQLLATTISVMSDNPPRRAPPTARQRSRQVHG